MSLRLRGLSAGEDRYDRAMGYPAATLATREEETTADHIVRLHDVSWTSGGIDKLQLYRKLGVGEVWFWRRGTIQVYVLRGDAYQPAAASAVLQGIDLAHLVGFLDRETTYDAIRDYRAALTTP